MKERPCPVCGNTSSDVIMQFSPELLAKVNPCYRPEVLEKSLADELDNLTYSRCGVCNMVYSTHYWDDSVLGAVYQDSIDHDHSRQKTLKIDKRMVLLKTWGNILRVLKMGGRKQLGDLKLIDYGCGWGDFLDTVAGHGVEVVGFDQDSIKTALPMKRGHTVCRSHEELEAFGPVDVFVMNCVIEHLQDVDEVFQFIDKVLKPGGVLVFSTMDYRPSFLGENARLVKEGSPRVSKNLNPIEHVNVYDYNTALTTLKKEGYKFISTGFGLYLTDIYGLRSRSFALGAANWLERQLSKVITGKDLSIEVYARK